MELQLIQSKIYEIRGFRVILDKDLAELYEVTTSNMNKAVKRNLDRFPDDFMFQWNIKLGRYKEIALRFYGTWSGYACWLIK